VRVVDLDPGDARFGEGEAGDLREEAEAESGADERVGGGGFVDLADDARFEVAVGEEPVEEVALPLAGAGDDERFRCEVLYGHFRCGGEAVSGRGGEPGLFDVHDGGGDAGGADRLRRKAEVDLVGAEGLLHLVRGHLEQSHLDLGVRGFERGDGAGERQEGLGGEPDAARAAFDGRGDGAPAGFEFAEGAFDVVAEEGPGRVEPQAARAVEEGRAEFGFEAGDGAAERGLGDAELGGGATEMLFTCDREELVQGVQVH